MEEMTNKGRMTVTISLIATMFFAAINQTIVSAALPKIIAQLGGIEYYSWVITIYMLCSTISTVLLGKLSDIYGRKKFIIIGILIFLIGSLLIGLSTNIFQMIAFRGIQGVGGGALMSITLAGIGDLYPPQERSKWTGVMMSIFGLSSILGPVLGGIIVDYMAWKWLFWIFLPLGIVVLFLIWRLFPKTKGDETEPIDFIGSIFLVITISSLLLGISLVGSKYAFGLFTAAILGLVILILIERKAKSPVMPLSLFKNKGITISNIASFLMSGGMMGAMAYIPFYIQGVQGQSATTSGLINIPMSIMLIIFSALGGRWLSKTENYRLFAVLGLGIMGGSMLIMANMNSIVWAGISLVIFGVGVGFGMTVFVVAAQNSAPSSQLGIVTATNTLFRNMGGTVLIAVFGSIMNTSMIKNIEKLMTSDYGINLNNLNPAIAEKFNAINAQSLLDKSKLDAIQAAIPGQFQDLFWQKAELVRLAMGQSLSDVFFIGAVLLFAGLVISLFLKVSIATEVKIKE